MSSPFGWIESDGHNYGRWVCDCGAKGMRSMYAIPGQKLVLLLEHFERTHGGRGTPIHGPRQCDLRYCPFHNPSNHSMVGFPKTIRYDRCMLVERICPHGIGHPDPDSLIWVNEYRAQKRWDRDDGTHGCDGCCARREADVRNEEKRFKELVQDMLNEGNYPGPSAIVRRLRARFPFRYGLRSNSHSLSGRECRWREQVLLDNGWTYAPGRKLRKWVKPK